ncbi:major facilitator superfamily transporter [Xylogone sp. PMI_703]|nr:major facilitator superfamily transporter [Xylogone sp. PMI_703]
MTPPNVDENSASTPEQKHSSSPIDVEKSSVNNISTMTGATHIVGKSQLSEDDTTMKHDTEYPPFRSVLSITVALYLAVLLIALDRTVIATAIPRITDAFNSLDDVGWYGSAYNLTICSVQLLFGRSYKFYSPKWVFLAAIILFEVGSAICGAAPNSAAFIVGRATAGLGAGGIFSGAIVIIVYTTPLQKRPMYTGFLGAVFGVASVAAPLLGGAFTDKVSWRWCFYINLPIGGLAIAIIVFVLQLPNPSSDKHTVRQRIEQFDPHGTICFLPGMVCLILALQWGGTTYAWSSGRIIALLIIAGVLLLAFIGVQVWKKEDCTVPPRIFTQRSIFSGFLFAMCLNAALITFIYYIAIWFQAVKGASAVKSGIMNLPMVLGLVLASIMSGAGVSAVGYYTPAMIISSVLMATGAGLMTTFDTSTGHSKWISYQVIFGLGLGAGMQQPGTAAQVVLNHKDISTGISLMFFAQYFGSALFVAIANTIFTNKLQNGLAGIPGLDTKTIMEVGATAVRSVVGPDQLPAVLKAYNNAVVATFYLGLVMVGLSIMGALGMEWRSVKTKKAAQRKTEDGNGKPSQTSVTDSNVNV